MRYWLEHVKALYSLQDIQYISLFFDKPTWDFSDLSFLSLYSIQHFGGSILQLFFCTLIVVFVTRYTKERGLDSVSCLSYGFSMLMANDQTARTDSNRSSCNLRTLIDPTCDIE